MGTHSRLSPSSRYRWQACPASADVAARYEGDGKSSPSAIDGTHTHTLLEHCLKNGRDANSYFGMVLRDHEGVFSPDHDRCARVQIALDYIASRVEQFPQAKILAETRVDPSALLGREDMGGTVDVQLRTPDMLELIDYKDGMNTVEAKDNPQLEQYFFGVIGDMASKGEIPTFSTVRLTIVQPKLALTGGNPVSFHDYPFNELFCRMPKLIEEANATDNSQTFVAGDKQCKYCPHKVNCKEFNDYTFGKAGIKFAAVREEVEAKSGEQLTDDELREMLEVAPLLRKLLEEAEAEALRRITSGHPIDGLKVVAGAGRRGWAFPEEEMEAKLKRFGLPKEVIWKRTLISPAQAEKIKWQKRDGSEKQLTPKQIAVMNNEFVTKSDGKLTVVPESDRREARSFGDLSKMFQAVPAAPEAPAAPEVEAPLPSWLS